MTDDLDSAVAAADEAARRPLEDDLRALYRDGKAVAGAEIAFQKARALFAAGKIKNIAIYGVAALIFLHFALVALTVGLLLTLAPLIGPFGATLVVFGALLLAAVIGAFLAMGQWKRLTAVLSDREGR